MIALSSSVGGRLVLSNVCRTEVSKIEHELGFKSHISLRPTVRRSLIHSLSLSEVSAEGGVGGTELSTDSLVERVVNV